MTRPGFALALLLLVSAGSAAALEPPPRKPGLWRLSVSTDPNEPGHEYDQCIDAATDAKMRDTAGNTQCQKPEWRQDNDALVGETDCQYRNGPTHVVTRITGNPEADYKVEITQTSLSKANNQVVPKPLLLSAHWLGACKPGQAPGAVFTTDGHPITPPPNKTAPQAPR
jgi:hypothetical protein